MKAEDKGHSWVVIAAAIISGIATVLAAWLVAKSQTQAKAFEAAQEELKGRKEISTGTVIASLLSSEEFGRVAGPAWVAADGRTVSTESKYAKLTGRTQLPDLRGMFLRGLNEFEPGKVRKDKLGDPDNNREVGTNQPAATHRPIKNFTGIAVAAGAHSHDFDAAINYQAGAGDHDRAKPAGRSAKTAVAGEHTHPVEITGGGDEETRPGNVAVFYYIKID